MARTASVFVGACCSERWRVAWLTLYYLAVLSGVWMMASLPSLSPPQFVYQGF